MVESKINRLVDTTTPILNRHTLALDIALPTCRKRHMKHPSEESSVLQILRVSLHVMFAFLLILGFVMALRDGTPTLSLTLCTVALGMIYLAGTVAENRFAHGYFGGTPGANLAQLKPYLAILWLLLVVVLWALLLIHHLSFAWVMFPLVFLCLHLLPRIPGLLVVIALAGFSIIWPATRPDYDLNPGTFIGPTLGTILAIVISLAYRKLHEDSQTYRRTAERLRATQAELAQKEHEAGRLEERERLAREIHDTLAQGLSSIVLVSRAASAQAIAAQPQNAALHEQIDVIHRVASDNLAEARRFIRNLSSPALTSSLVPALQRLCAETQAQEAARGTALECALRVDGDFPNLETAVAELDSELQETLIRIAQGALANVSAHAQARHAVVTLGLWNHSTTLDIFDDGRGFIPPTVPATLEHDDGTGYGLTSLTARAQQVHGELAIESAPGEGTVVTFSLARPASSQPHHASQGAS